MVIVVLFQVTTVPFAQHILVLETNYSFTFYVGALERCVCEEECLPGSAVLPLPGGVTAIEGKECCS